MFLFQAETKTILCDSNYLLKTRNVLQIELFVETEELNQTHPEQTSVVSRRI